MKFYYIFIIITLTLLILFSGCITTNNNNSIKFTATLSLTGKYAFFGNAYKDGFILAQEEINNNGGINGKKLDLIIDDDKGEIQDAILNINKFKEIDNSKVIYTLWTHIGEAVKKMDLNDTIVFFVSTVPNFANDSELHFRDFYDVQKHAFSIANKAKDDGCKGVYLLTEKNTQGNIFKTTVEQVFNDSNIIKKIDQILPEDSDFKTTIAKFDMKTGNCLITSNWRQEDNLMKTLKEYGLLDKIKTYHWVAPLSDNARTKEIENLFNENKTISTWYGLNYSSNETKQKEFISKYKNRFGKEPFSDAIYAYDDLHFVANAMKYCDENTACISNYLRSNTYSGVAGNLEFDANGSSTRSTKLIQMINNNWITIN